MNSNRCYSCGLLNFTSASSCKRCKAEFQSVADSVSANYAEVPQGGYQAVQAWPQPGYEGQYFPPPSFSGPIAPLPRASKHGATNAVLWVMLCITLVIAFGIAVAWRFNKSGPVNYVWQEYQPADNSYSVLMPVKPIESVQRQQTPAGELQVYISSAILASDGACVAGYSDYPETIRSVSPDEILDAGANGAVRSSGATLLSKKKIMLDGYQGLEIEMKLPAEAMQGKGRAISRIYWVPSRLYIMVAVGTDTSAMDETMKKFLHSFKLRKRS